MADVDGAQAPDGSQRAILIRDFADVQRPLAQIRSRFLGGAHWLSPLAVTAQGDGEAVRLRIGPDWAPESIARTVEVTVGLVHHRGSNLVVPLSWEASGLRSMFPLLDGEVEVSPLDDHSSRLTLSGSYTPPWGPVGATLDRALLHRVATSTVRSFLNQVAANLMSDPG
ncbi:MAG: hypothetical protein WCJ42_09790 [Actinomycetes bacterium]